MCHGRSAVTPELKVLYLGVLAGRAWLALMARALCGLPVASHALERALGCCICPVRACAARAHNCKSAHECIVIAHNTS